MINILDRRYQIAASYSEALSHGDIVEQLHVYIVILASMQGEFS